MCSGKCDPIRAISWQTGRLVLIVKLRSGPVQREPWRDRIILQGSYDRGLFATVLPSFVYFLYFAEFSYFWPLLD